MKEEIFLFYKKEVEPRIKFLFSYLGRYRSFLPALNLLFKSNHKEESTEVFFEYLTIHKNDYARCLEQQLKPIIFQTNETSNLKKENVYLIVGQYDKIIFVLNYLRKEGFKALWDQTWMEPDGNKPLWKRRVSVVEAIYTDLITEKIENKNILMDEKSEWIEFEFQIFKTYSENKEEYKALLSEYLKEGWDLNRINPITTSIILEAIAEYQALKTSKLVLITQSVKTAKNYCGDADYKIINAILDSYFKSRSLN